MRVLVIGQGGREHAICWKLRQSPQVTELYCAPGNPGMAAVAENVALAVDDLKGLTEFAAGQQIDLTIVGPEYPLSLGLVDALRQAGQRGPAHASARIVATTPPAATAPWRTWPGISA